MMPAGRAHAVQTGAAAEAMVVADLWRAGFLAAATHQAFPYDVFIDRDGHTARVQVKSASRPMLTGRGAVPTYFAKVTHGGAGRASAYGDHDFDILAFVALDIGAVAYVLRSEINYHVWFRQPGNKLLRSNAAPAVDECTIEAAWARLFPDAGSRAA